MDITLTRFVTALRRADVRVSTAETLDAFAVVDHIGIADRGLLHDALSLVLAKSPIEKQRFTDCFHRLFEELAFARAPSRQPLAGVEAQALLDTLPASAGDELRGAVAAVVGGHREALTLRLQHLAAALEVHRIRTLRDKSHYARALAAGLGAGELPGLIAAAPTARERDALAYVRQYLSEEIRAYVDAQYRLHVDASGRRALIDRALDANLDQVPREYYADVEAAVRRIADELIRQRRKRRRRSRRGQLDVKRTLRRNVAYDGALFDLTWRRRRVQHPTVFVVCDVSASVGRVARFLLLLLYQLADVLPAVRAFAFSNELGEVTNVLRERPLHVAIEEVLFEWGKGTTDYGRALAGFRTLAGAGIDHRSTVIVLGDGRGNYFEPRADVLAQIAGRARQVLWLNPESPETWRDGDSAMARYAPYCFRVRRLATLDDLERFADDLVAAHE